MLYSGSCSYTGHQAFMSNQPNSTTI